MSRKQLQRIGVRSMLAAVVLTTVFGLGSATAFVLSREGWSASSNQDESEHPHEEAHDEEEDHVALTKQAYDNLELRMGGVTKDDYWKSLLVPGRVVEIPGRSTLSVSASVTGIVEEVNVLPGQSLDTQTCLFTIRITEESLIDAQSKLLELMTRQEVAEQEIERLQSLVASGAVSGSKARDLRYEVKQLKAQESALLQELATRGMPETAIAELRQSRQLTTFASVYTPDFAHNSGIRSSSVSAEGEHGYSVETLNVHPGMAVKRGDALCTVAYHPLLYIEGTTFQDDLPTLERIVREGWKIIVETHENDGKEHEPMRLELLRIDNHVDEETQTVRFYLELHNEVQHTRKIEGRKFEQWKFRPGQRLHLQLPTERWVDQVTLPADAVVVDGPNVFIFAEHHHDEDSAQVDPARRVSSEIADHGHEHEHAHEHEHEHEVFMELEPVSVHLLHRDDRFVVIADDGRLHQEEIALNNAYKLYLAMKMQSGGGGAHHHHDH